MLLRPGLVEGELLKSSIMDLQDPKAREVLIRVNVCGVCRTDLHLVEGDLTTPVIPIIPGHQIVGIIEKTGSGIDNLKVGDRVGLPWMSSTCLSCVHCLGGSATYAT